MALIKALLLTEGYHGMISQVEGMAKALKTEFHHKIVRLSWPWNYVPPKFTPISQIVLKDKNYINDNKKIDLIISCGRKSVIPSIILKNSNKKIVTIHIQDPKVNLNNFDIIIAPEHDNLNEKNVISSRGAIHYITQEEIKKSKSYLIDKFQLNNYFNEEKLVAIILGGPNKYYSFSDVDLTKIFERIKIYFIDNGHQAIVIPSMRTPQRIIEIAKKYFDEKELVINEIDKKAYLSALGLARYIIITCDSTSMISEAAATGKPIFIAHMQPKRNNYRFKKFFQLFKEIGITRNLGDKVEIWTYENFNEAERIATILNKKLNN